LGRLSCYRMCGCTEALHLTFQSVCTQAGLETSGTACVQTDGRD